MVGSFSKSAGVRIIFVFICIENSTSTNKDGFNSWVIRSEEAGTDEYNDYNIKKHILDFHWAIYRAELMLKKVHQAHNEAQLIGLTELKACAQSVH